MAIRKKNLLGNHWGAFSLRETSVRTDGCEMPAVRKQGGGMEERLAHLRGERLGSLG